MKFVMTTDDAFRYKMKKIHNRLTISNLPLDIFFGSVISGGIPGRQLLVNSGQTSEEKYSEHTSLISKHLFCKLKESIGTISVIISLK